MRSIELDHTIVPARDKERAARFFARIFGLAYEGPSGPFAPVRVNEALTLDFDDRGSSFEIHHYAFRVSGEAFDAIFARVQAERIPYGSFPWSRTDGQSARVIPYTTLVRMRPSCEIRSSRCSP